MRRKQEGVGRCLIVINLPKPKAR